MPDAYAFVIGKCYGCGRMFTFNPIRVPSVRDERGVRQPICRACIEYVNQERKKIGKEPFTIPPDAYEPVREEELSSPPETGITERITAGADVR